MWSPWEVAMSRIWVSGSMARMKCIRERESPWRNPLPGLIGKAGHTIEKYPGRRSGDPISKSTRDPRWLKRSRLQSNQIESNALQISSLDKSVGVCSCEALSQGSWAIRNYRGCFFFYDCALGIWHKIIHRRPLT
jgi:hypothetical protein